MSEEKKHYQRPLNFKTGKVEMNFGAGGKASAQLIADLFAKNFSNEFLDQGDDGARLPQPKGELIMATDSHVVSPIFFAGGDIGGLSIHGTVNDVAVCGATPLYISCGFILEEGFPLSDLKRIVESMAAAAKEAGVKIVTGDTKVVERGKARRYLHQHLRRRRPAERNPSLGRQRRPGRCHCDFRRYRRPWRGGHESARELRL